MPARRLAAQLAEVQQHVRRLARLAGDPPAAAFAMALTEFESGVATLRAAQANVAAQAEQLQQAQAALESERQRYAALFDFAPDGYLVTDAAGAIREANRAAARLLGVRAARLARKPLAKYIAPDYRVEFRAFVNSLTLDGITLHWEGALKPRAGPAVPVEFLASPACDPLAGHVVEVRWRLHDISVTKALQAEQAMLLGSLRELASRLEAVREHEQARLARQVHDEIGGALSAIKIDLARVRDALPSSPETNALNQRLADAAFQVERAAQSARNIATELRPAVLDRLGLVAAVGWQLEQFEQRSGVTCQIKVGAAATAVPPPIAEAVFRVYQELLTNVARHAQASRVEVRLAQEDGQLVLEVRDNGIGITREAGSAVASLGLLGSRERLREFGGTLDVQPARGKGTLARIAVPLPQPT
jgi:PAS domain S-box-containing protein